MINEYLNNKGSNRNPSEPTVYTKINQEGKILIVCLYIDDFIFDGGISIDDFETMMKKIF